MLTLRLARPEKRNALDDTMMYALIDAIDAAGRDEAVRAVVLTSEGDHFCSGFDILGRNQPGAARPRVGSLQRRLPAHAHRLIPVILEVQVPVVCVVRGWAAGIGLNLALVADFTVAATDAAGSGHRSSSAASPPTAAPPGCCRAASARHARARCSS